MTDRVWLVRHASTNWTGRRWCGRTDLALSPQGRAEADALASSLASSLPPDLEIRSSPLRRAVETADALASRVGTAVEIDDQLREVDFGSAEGMTWDEVLADLPETARALLSRGNQIDWPDGEPAADVRRRAAAAFALAARRPTSCVLVTHGGLIREILSAAGIDPVPQVVPPATSLALRRRRSRGWAIDE